VLANQPIDPMILATDLAVAREFYGERIGLELLLESDDFLTFRCGGESRLVVTAAPPAPPSRRPRPPGE
jgi:extradiol dioxygenase family protein